MTCIVGIVQNGKVYIGGDSAGVAGYSITVRADEKVFKKGEFIMGFTTSFRMGQLLRYKLIIPFHKPGVDTYEYMVTEFVEAVRQCLKDGGYSRNNSGEELGGTFLVGYKGELFTIDGDYQVGKSLLGYDAIGCGEDIAKGSMFTSCRLADVSPDEILLDALKAAEQFSTGVRGPFTAVSI
jgi:ATP-dependent protease HslVU (ClpYQ) peptidase subunit